MADMITFILLMHIRVLFYGRYGHFHTTCSYLGAGREGGGGVLGAGGVD